MPSDRPVEKAAAYYPPLFRFRVLAEFDEDHKVFVARCLETGHVVTADDITTVTEMIKEILEDEIAYGIERQNFPNLLSAPASPDVWLRWMECARKTTPDEVMLSVSAKPLRLDELEVGAEIAVASSS